MLWIATWGALLAAYWSSRVDLNCPVLFRSFVAIGQRSSGPTHDNEKDDANTSAAPDSSRLRSSKTGLVCPTFAPSSPGAEKFSGSVLFSYLRSFSSSCPWSHV